jgi:flagellar basal-body rod protein FlgC
MFGSLSTSTSGLVAQRTRMEVISANMANQNSIYNAEGEYEPFRRRIAVFAPGGPNGNEKGVHVEQIKLDQSELRKQYKPGHPEANENGYVKYPNVDPMMEQVNAMGARRAYQANITAAEATKSMLQSSMRLLA